MRWSIWAILFSASSALVGAGWQALSLIPGQERPRDGEAAGSDPLSGVEPGYGPDHPMAVVLPYLEHLPEEAAFASPMIAIALVAAAYYALRLIGFLLSIMSFATAALAVALFVYPEESTQLRQQLSGFAEQIVTAARRATGADDAPQPDTQPRGDQPRWPILPGDGDYGTDRWSDGTRADRAAQERGSSDDRISGGISEPAWDPADPVPVEPIETGLDEARSIMGGSQGR